MAPLVFWVFWRRGFTLIWRIDGWTQYSKVLAYYGIWLRDLIRQWCSGNLELPAFSVSIGYGADVITTFQYYTVGDPLNLLSVLVPVAYTDVLYSLLVLARFYLAGLVFVCVTPYLLKHRSGGVILGALAYAFSGWMIYRVAENPFFAVPVILFPLVIYGIERVLRDGKPFALVLSVAASAFSNFYFFYMITLLSGVYVFVRVSGLILRGKAWFALRRAGWVIASATAGVLLSALSLIPIVLAFLESSRAGGVRDLPTLYPGSYYRLLFLQFSDLSAEAGQFAYVYGGPLVLLAIIWLLRRYRRNLLFVALLFVAGVLFAFPAGGFVFNGCSYVTNRWVWAWAYLACTLIVLLWKEAWCGGMKNAALLLVGVGAYAAVAALVIHRGIDASVAFHSVSGILLAAFAAALFLVGQDSRFVRPAKAGVAAVSISGLVLASYWHYGSHVSSFVEKGTWASSIDGSDSATVARVAEEEPLARYEYIPGLVNGDNTSLLHGVGSTEFYWSIDRSSALRWLEAYGVSDMLSYYRQGLDGRSILGALTGRSYIVAREDSPVPYGFVHDSDYFDVRSGLTLSLYRTDQAAPLGYTYRGRLEEAHFSELSPSEREEVMLRAVFVEGGDVSLAAEDLSDRLGATQIGFRIEADAGVGVSDDSIEIPEASKTIKLLFENPVSGEAHVFFRGFDAQTTEGPTAPNNQFIDADFECVGESHSPVRFRYITDQWTWFEGREDFIINSRHCGTALKSVTLRFENAGSHTFDSLEVWSQPLEGFGEAVAELSAEKLENVDFHDIGLSRATSEITGDVTVSEPKVLVVTIPKTDGWTAYVDGKQQEILTANMMWMGLELEPGHHDIRLVYRTPGLYEGAAVSGLTAVGLLGWVVLSRRKRRAGQGGASGSVVEAGTQLQKAVFA